MREAGPEMQGARTIGWLVGTIVIGAVGSGLWDVAFRPGVNILSRVTLTVATLGLESARDSIYADVAMGHHELPSLYLLLAAFTAFMSIFGFISGQWYFKRQRGRVAALSEEGRERRRNRLNRALSWLLGVFAVFSVILLVRFVMINYTNIAITYFEQSLAICGPYLTDQEAKEIRSGFARIKKREDYVKIMQLLEGVAEPHGLKLPQFTIW
jgi:hypothetical protein